MPANRQYSTWNPQIALAVVAVGILSAVWLNMAKLKMGMGQPQHDISQVPIAQNITSDEIEQLRNGKPLELILSERPNYSQLAASVAVPKGPATSETQKLAQPEAQTSTAFPGPKLEPCRAPSPDVSLEDAVPAPLRSLPATRSPEDQSGFRQPFRDPAVTPVSFPEKQSEGEQVIPNQVAPEEVPRANPAGSFSSGGGGSFLEKFPGQSQQLPNLKHGPAENPAARPLLNEPLATAPKALPTASELTPPPYGDFAAAVPPQPAAAPVNPPGVESPGVGLPAVESAPLGPAPAPTSFGSHQAATPATQAPAALAKSTMARGASTAQPARATYPRVLTEERETWWTLAQRVYDDGRLFRELYEFNREQFPDYNLIPAGREVVCPPRELLERFPAAAPDLATASSVAQTRRYQTRQGETLFEIARSQLGQASRFAELLQLNRDHLPEGAAHLTPLPAGTELILPKQ
ncbi:MAG: hypothetical protein ACK6DS_05880 [Planctomycetota bacterium]